MRRLPEPGIRATVRITPLNHQRLVMGQDLLLGVGPVEGGPRTLCRAPSIFCWSPLSPGGGTPRPDAIAACRRPRRVAVWSSTISWANARMRVSDDWASAVCASTISNWSDWAAAVTKSRVEGVMGVCASTADAMKTATQATVARRT